MIIKQKYLDLIKQGKIQSDDVQLKVVSYLEQLYHSLNEKNKQNKKKKSLDYPLFWIYNAKKII